MENRLNTRDGLMTLNHKYVDLLIDYLREYPEEFHLELTGTIEERDP